MTSPATAIDLLSHDRIHHGTYRQIPPRPVVGRHHLREEGCGSETLSSYGDVDNDDDGVNDDGRFRLNVPPFLIINVMPVLDKMHFNKLLESLGTG